MAEAQGGRRLLHDDVPAAAERPVKEALAAGHSQVSQAKTTVRTIADTQKARISERLGSVAQALQETAESLAPRRTLATLRDNTQWAKEQLR